MKISVGPAPSHWGRERIESFYRELCQSPVDYVYLGEIACPERSCFTPDFFNRLCDELSQAGKKVYASSLILVRDEKQYRAFEEMAQRLQRVEINSPAFLGLARRWPCVTGTFLNVYNSAAVNILAKHMVERIVLSPELSFQSITSITKRCTVATELIVHGYVPIAMSGTCQTARSLGQNGHGCGKSCQCYPEGMVLMAGDRSLFRIEGPQTLSAAIYCLVEYLPWLEKAGIDTIRILPQWNHTGRIVNIYRDVLHNRRDCRDAVEELKAITPVELCNGWLLGKAGWLYESPDRTQKSEDRNQKTEVRNQKSEVRLLSSVFCRLSSVVCPLPSVLCRLSSVVSSKDCRRAWSTNDIIREVNQLLEVMHDDPQFIKKIAGFKGVVVVLSASDTGREFIIELNKQGVRVRPYSGQPFDVNIQATEQVLWAVLSGQMDADTAFFSGKVRICGSIATAFRVKNSFLSLLQRHLSQTMKANTS
ncbi:MAG: U32 family peptidase [Sedimentisphaerales bacterium]